VPSIPPRVPFHNLHSFVSLFPIIMYRTVTQAHNTKSQAQLDLIREQRRKAEAQLKQLQEQEQALLLGRANRDLNSNQFTGGGPEVFTHLNGLSQAAPVMHQTSSTSRQEPPIANDYLSYLDQIKNTYLDRPDVYNRFVDIMTDFKSNAIDTLGVVSQTANLFYDAPTLIAGFRTFLPPGWKVECGIEGDSGTARAVSPGGTITTIPPSNHHGTTHLPQSRSYSTETVSRASLFGVSEASSTNLNRGHTITYVNKIKVSLTAIFSSMNQQLRKKKVVCTTQFGLIVLLF
jgi:Paired amphipathic helix repeat